MTDPFDRAVNKELVQGARIGFYIHFGVYVAVQVLLFAIWFFTPHTGEVVPWFLYPLLGWGIGLAVHFITWRASVARSRRPVA